MMIPKYSDPLIFELQVYVESYLQKDSSSWDSSWTIIHPFPQACSAKPGPDIFAPHPLGSCTPPLCS